MKKKIVAALALMALAAPNAFAAPTAASGDGVALSVHDMNVVEYGITPDEQGRICAFCHTPHHAIQDATVEYLPLWSHELTAMAFANPYTSATFDAETLAPVDPLAGPSRLCMSCHDGVIAVDQHYGFAGGTVFNGDQFTGATPQIAVGLNGDFTNDHPVGFDIADVAAVDSGIFPDVATGHVFNGTTMPIVDTLYSSIAGMPGTIMTCATCHDVHNKDNVVNTGTVVRNYLVYADQNGSDLCLSCHDK